MPQYRNSRINIPIPKASYDGQYWGRYPNGDKPGPGMSSAAPVGVSAGGILTTNPGSLVGNASVGWSGSGILTTGGGATLTFAPGHYTHCDSFRWQTAAGAADSQQLNFNANITKWMSNPYVRGVVIYLRIGDVTQIQGNIQPGINAVNTILNKIQTTATAVGRNLATNPFYVGFIGPILRLFPNSGSPTSPDNWGYWPGKGWVADCQQYYGVAGRSSQFTFAQAGITDYANIMALLAAQFKNNRQIAFWASHDESSFFVSAQVSGVLLTPATMTPSYLTLIENQDNAWKGGIVPIMARCNWFQGGSGEISDANLFFNTLIARGPQIFFGGPDPGVRDTTAQQVLSGREGTVGDLRRNRVWAGMVQETYLGGSPNPQDLVPPSNIAASEIGPIVPNQVAGSWTGTAWTTTAPWDQHAYFMIWNGLNNYVYQYDNPNGGTSTIYPNGPPTKTDIVQTISAMGGLTNTDIPSSLQ